MQRGGALRRIRRPLRSSDHPRLILRALLRTLLGTSTEYSTPPPLLGAGGVGAGGGGGGGDDTDESSTSPSKWRESKQAARGGAGCVVESYLEARDHHHLACSARLAVLGPLTLSARISGRQGVG